MKTENGIVKSFTFGTSGWNIPTFNIELEVGSGCSVCALGSICIMNDDPYTNYKTNNNYTAYFISKVFEVFGINEINDIIGKPVRAIFEKDGRPGDSCIGLQHFLKEEIFFIPSLLKDKDLDLSDILDTFNLERYNADKEFYRIAQNLSKTHN